MRTKAMVATEHFRYLAEKIGVMGEAQKTLGHAIREYSGPL